MGSKGAIATAAAGAVLLVIISVFGFGFLPGIIENAITNAVVLQDDTIQLERFQDIPFPMHFKAYIFNITNVDQVLNGGQPHLQELGPYVYRLYRERVVEAMDDDTISYRILDRYEFDAEDSFPFTEEDVVAIANTPYNAILQAAEAQTPNLMSVINLASSGIFGPNNSPIMTVAFKDLAFDGVRICESPGLIGQVACTQIRMLSANSPNLAEVNGNFQFSLFGYRLAPTNLLVAFRGLSDSSTLGQLSQWDLSPTLPYWPGTQCNMLNGTDSAIFKPFINKEQSIYAFNPDICRSVELRYQYDTNHNDLELYRFASNELFLDNNEGCFCLNQTVGVATPDGCLLSGVMELNSCVGAPLVLSYPHFLFADLTYLNGVRGLSPDLESHRIFLDIEPMTGTPVVGAKRAQFNVFLRPITGIVATQNLRPTLVPMFWIEEGVVMPEEYSNIILTSLYLPFTVLPILLPTLVALSSLVLLLGLGFLVRSRRKTTLA